VALDVGSPQLGRVQDDPTRRLELPSEQVGHGGAVLPPPSVDAVSLASSWPSKADVHDRASNSFAKASASL
jgi:hypothetical protein